MFFVEASVLNQLVSHRLARLRMGSPADAPLDYRVYAPDAGPDWERAWMRTFELLRATRDAAKGLSAGYMIVSASTPQGVLGAAEGRRVLEASYPALVDLELDPDLPDRRRARFAAEEGIPFLALEPLLREKQATRGTLHWPINGHWNVRGNDEAAREIARFVREEGPLAPIRRGDSAPSRVPDRQAAS